MPKFGFNNPNKVEYKAINLDTLQELVTKSSVSVVDLEVLLKNGLVSKNDRVKVLSRGELKSKVDVNVHALSKAAIAAIEKAGGKTTVL